MVRVVVLWVSLLIVLTGCFSPSINTDSKHGEVLLFASFRGNGQDGRMLDQYFSNQVKVDNQAREGRGSRTVIKEHLWKKLIDDVQANDIVMI